MDLQTVQLSAEPTKMEKLYIKYKSPLAFLLLMVLLGGGFAYFNMKTSLFPNVTFPKIKIIAENGDQPVDKMMVTVTKPLEDAIKKVENLTLIRSTTSMGSCEISAFMEWGSDIDLDKQRIESRIAQIKTSLAAGVQITIEKMNPSILPVMGFALQSDSKNQIELKMIADYIVKPYLSRIEGVSSVEIIGGKTKEYRIILDQQKIEALKLNPQLVLQQLQQTDFIQSTGHTIDFKRLYLTVTDATISDKNQLETLEIFSTPNRVVRVSDIATTTIAERNEYIRIKADGKNVPLIAVLKQPDANLVDVAKKVNEQVASLEKLLPKGVSLVPYYNQATFVNTSIRSIIDVLWVGLLLAIIVVIAFLRSFRASAVILITIPLTLAFTFIVLFTVGYDFNIMTIGAIAAAIGLIIDDAIIVLEQIHRTQEEHPDEPASRLIGKAVQFLFPSMVASSLSTIVILIPFELMSGVAGAYFRILTQTMIITLLCSFFITWLGLPVIYLLFSVKKPRVKTEAHHESHSKWVRFFTVRPWIAALILIGLLIPTWILLPRLQTGFLPEMDEGSIVLDFNSPPGTSLVETDEMLQKVDAILEKVPEVDTYSRRIGTQMGFFITEPNRGDYLIELKQNRTRTTEEVSDDIRGKVEQSLPALTVDFGQVITDMLGDLMSSAQPIEVKIFGNNHETIKELSRQIVDSIATVSGTADVFDGIVQAGPIFKVVPDEARLKLFGLSAADLQQQLAMHIEGVVAGSIPEKEQLTDIRLIFPENNQTSINAIKKIKICSPDGVFFPLSSFATFDIKPGVSEIERENLQTVGIVSARLNQRDLGTTMHDIQQKLAKIQLPPAYQIVYGGAYAEQQKSFSELLLILFTGGLLVFSVVLFMFKSIPISLSVLLISIFGISGSVLALFMTHTPLNVGSYTGLIMIIGIIGENSIFTIQQFLFYLKQSDVKQAVSFAIATRLRPKLMTALGAIMALLPLAYGIGPGAQMHQPLAIAVIGGLLAALPLLLLVLPVVLLLIYRNN